MTIMEAPLAQLIQELVPQLNLRPSIGLLEIEPSEPDEDSYEPEEMDGEWYYDAPEMTALEFETGEGPVDDDAWVPESSETFELYVWRRLMEEFGPDPDEKYNRWLGWLLEDPGSTKVPDETFKAWFARLKMDFPGLPASDRILSPLPDIVFEYAENGELSFKVNIDMLESMLINAGTDKYEKFDLDLAKGRTVKLISLGVADLRNLCQTRSRNMQCIAAFLVENQAAFLRAPDMQTAMERLRSMSQVGLINTLKATGAGGGRTDRSWASWASKIIKDKWVVCPFSGQPLPLGLFSNQKATTISGQTAGLFLPGWPRCWNF